MYGLFHSVAISEPKIYQAQWEALFTPAKPIILFWPGIFIVLLPIPGKNGVVYNTMSVIVKRHEMSFLRQCSSLDIYQSAISCNCFALSLTDRDARMVKDKDSKYMGYNCQMAVDEKNHAIVGAEVFNEASDRGLLRPMIEEVKGRTGKDLSQTDISVDAGYFSSDNIRYCHE
jgi:hypothetical protein